MHIRLHLVLIQPQEPAFREAVMIALVGNATLLLVTVSLFLATVNLSKTRR